MEIRNFEAPLGAEIIGLDLNEPLDSEAFSQISQAWADRGVIVVRGQISLTLERYVAFARLFGDLEIMKVYTEFISPLHPEIFVVSNVIENGKPIGLQDAGQIWHSDGSFRPEPPMGSLLHAIEIPRANGKVLGDTIFSSSSAAYTALPIGLRKRLDRLWAVHRLNDGRSAKTPTVSEGRANLTDTLKKGMPQLLHPVVRIHPLTGRDCLYINPLFTSQIADMPPAESEALLAELFLQCTKLEFCYRHQWCVGDIVMWDNCSTQHNAIGDYGILRRRMNRITIQGSTPFNGQRQTSRSWD